MPTKPSQTITSALPLKMSRPSTLPMKLMGSALSSGKASRVSSLPLVLFFADGEQADARLGDLEHAAGVHLAHDGELLEILRLAVDVGAHVEQHAGIAL